MPDTDNPTPTPLLEDYLGERLLELIRVLDEARLQQTPLESVTPRTNLILVAAVVEMSRTLKSIDRRVEDLYSMLGLLEDHAIRIAEAQSRAYPGDPKGY